MIDFMAPACGSAAVRGGPIANLWITGGDVDNCVAQWPPVGEGVVGGGRIFCAVRFSGLTSRARARSPVWKQPGGRTGSGGPWGPLLPGSGHRYGHQGERPPGRERQTEQRVRGSTASAHYTEEV